MISEAIAKDLKTLNCPHVVAPHQIQALDIQALFPAIQWLTIHSKKPFTSSNAHEGVSRLEFSKFGKAIEVLELKSGVEIPTPRRNEIVVKMTATPIHPSILGLIKGQFFFFDTCQKCQLKMTRSY